MRALVLGAGRMGAFHRRALRDLGYDVTTVDPDPAAGADCRVVPHRDFDAVCIVTPISHLAEQAAEWAGRPVSLLVEKPMAATLEQAVELAALLDGQPAAVGYVERFNPQVRRLRALLADSSPRSVRFRRHNDRPTPDVALDLTSHDVDLAAFLGLECPVTFDSRASLLCERVRAVEVGGRWSVDLMAHDTSPLHAQWHAFLSGRPGCATPADAVHVLTALADVPVLLAA